ncbi:hypothetical protein [Sphingomonas sp. BK235]|uniref:hypothetical protein n=1 Tax=Sphingomonas sp. BK235 TaxID=2512131 RepID=UPI001044979D|nr:hypothetical protein [Sphingomonas sp. BK235]TCP30685.1 hypothetical protein EV292_11242 [Sphingomonas sp. BK235]
MAEFWVIYDPIDGNERWRGSGPAGASALQEIPEGLSLAVVPMEVVRTAQLDLEVLRTFACRKVDQSAEALRMRFLTPGAGQAITYTRKEAEARAWSIDNSVAVPFLTREAAARSMTLADLAAEVISQADAWVMVGAEIEGMRMGAKTSVAAAETFGAIVAAAELQWPA